MTKIKSPCKVNLFLDITGKREDGYHLIESIFHTVSLYDEIFIEESNEYSITTEGKYALKDNTEENICTKVFNYFKNSLKKNYSIHIIKNIPTGAGLGGGSSNASSIIKFFIAELQKEQNRKYDNIIEICSKFGSDIPFFIKGGLSWVSGIGEKIENYNFTIPYHIILIYPNIHVSTKEAYSRFDSKAFNKSDRQTLKDILDNHSNNIDFQKFEGLLYNVFEENVFNMIPQIKEYKVKIENLLKRKTHMSGSGSSLFTLYDNSKECENDYDLISSILKKELDIYKLDLI